MARWCNTTRSPNPAPRSGRLCGCFPSCRSSACFRGYWKQRPYFDVCCFARLVERRNLLRGVKHWRSTLGKYKDAQRKSQQRGQYPSLVHYVDIVVLCGFLVYAQESHIMVSSSRSPAQCTSISIEIYTFRGWGIP